MKRYTIKEFNTSGVCKPERHYMLPPLSRIPEIDAMIDGSHYFIIKAPPHSGATTFLNTLTDTINSEGKYYALNCSLINLRGINNSHDAMDEIFAQINQAMYYSQVTAIKEKADSYNSLPGMYPETIKISEIIIKLCSDLDKELIIFFDDTECLPEVALIPFLKQVSATCACRNQKCKSPRSIAMVGVHDIRDLLTQVSPNVKLSKILSPFNVMKDALTLPNFTLDEMSSLFRKHVAASGQGFYVDAIDRVWYWTEGQPLLVNALVYETICQVIKNNYSLKVSDVFIDCGWRRLELLNYKYVDYLLEYLKNPRVTKVLDSIFASTKSKFSQNDVDRKYCLDLGIVVQDENNNLRLANMICRHIFLDVIIGQIQDLIEDAIHTNRSTNGYIIFMSSILKLFQFCWRKGYFDFILHNKNLFISYYSDATYSFILHAFIQRVLGSKDCIRRDFAQGRGSVDFYIEYGFKNYIIGVVIKGRDPIENIILQLSGSLEKIGITEGWLVIFDTNKNKENDIRKNFQTTLFEGKTIHLVFC